MATEEITLTPAELDALGAKLDSVDLSAKDKQILVAAFAVAAKAISNEDDVSGFQFGGSSFSAASFNSPNLQQGLTTGFQGSLSQGKMADFNNKAIIISVGF
jgi:hypothetical protein